MINSQSGAQKDKSGSNISRMVPSDVHELVLVDIRVLVRDIYSKFRFLALFAKGPVSCMSTVQFSR